MKLIVYLVFQDKIKKDIKKINWSEENVGYFIHMFSTKDDAVEAIKEYDMGKKAYTVVESAIGVDVLTNMASCAKTGNCWTDQDFEVLNVWNYGI